MEGSANRVWSLQLLNSHSMLLVCSYQELLLDRKLTDWLSSDLCSQGEKLRLPLNTINNYIKVIDLIFISFDYIVQS